MIVADAPPANPRAVNAVEPDLGPRRNRVVSHQFLIFAAIGLLNTALYVALYNAGRAAGLTSVPANAATLVITVGLSFVLNRRVTFGRDGRDGVGGELGRFLVTYTGTAAFSSAALWLLFWIQPDATKPLENLVAVGANAGLFVARFALLRWWVFRAHRGALDSSV